MEKMRIVVLWAELLSVTCGLVAGAWSVWKKYIFVVLSFVMLQDASGSYYDYFYFNFGGYNWPCYEENGEVYICSGCKYHGQISPAPNGTIAIPSEIGNTAVIKYVEFSGAGYYNRYGDYFTGNLDGLTGVSIPGSVKSVRFFLLQELI